MATIYDYKTLLVLCPLIHVDSSITPTVNQFMYSYNDRFGLFPKPPLITPREKVMQSKLKIGNELFRRGKLRDAINAYNDITKDSPLYRFAQQNIALIERRAQGNGGRIDKLITETSRTAKDAPQRVEDAPRSEPLLSIIMPVFNVDAYLEASLISVLNQSYENFELIIINDASTDGSTDIIKMFAALDTRIQSVSLEKNSLGGAGIPSNIGIQMARGDYIAFVDSDDFVPRDAFTDLVNLAERNGADVAIGNFRTFLNDSRVVSEAYDRELFDKLPKDKLLSPSEFLSIFHISPVPWRKIYRRTFLQKHSILYPHVDCFYEDNPLHWYVLSSTEKVVLSENLVSYHRMARQGQTMSASSYKLCAYFTHMDSILNHLGDKNIYLDSFASYIRKTTWIVQRQIDEGVKAIFKKRFAQIFKDMLPQIDTQSNKTLSNLTNYFGEYDKAYREVELTILVDAAEITAAGLERVQSLIDRMDLDWDLFLVVRSEPDRELLTHAVFDRANLHIFHSGKVKNKWRSLNTVIPLCSSMFVMFGDLRCDIIKDNIKIALNQLSNNSKRGFYAQPGWQDINSSIFSTRLLHKNGIFFGPSIHFGDFSLIELASLFGTPTEGKHPLSQSTSRACDLDAFDYRDLIAEARNYIVCCLRNPDTDRNTIFHRVSELLSAHESKIIFEDYASFRDDERKLVHGLLSGHSSKVIT